MSDANAILDLHISGEALKLEPGGIYAIRMTYPIPTSRIEAIRKLLVSAADSIGVKFVLFDHDMEIVRAPPEPCDLCSTQAGNKFCAHCGRKLE